MLALCWNNFSITKITITGITLLMVLANERKRYIVMPSLIGWTDKKNDRCIMEKLRKGASATHSLVIILLLGGSWIIYQLPNLLKTCMIVALSDIYSIDILTVLKMSEHYITFSQHMTYFLSDHKFHELHDKNLIDFADIRKSTGPRPVKTVEDQWKPLLCWSSCPVKKSCREPLYGDSNVEKTRSCKSFGGPVKLGLSLLSPVLRPSKGPTVFPKSGF